MVSPGFSSEGRDAIGSVTGDATGPDWVVETGVSGTASDASEATLWGAASDGDWTDPPGASVVSGLLTALAFASLVGVSESKPILPFISSRNSASWGAAKIHIKRYPRCWVNTIDTEIRRESASPSSL